MWILGKGEIYGDYREGNMLKADSDLSWVDATPEYTQWLNNTKQYFNFHPDSGVTIGQKDEKFYVNINSTEMGFYDNSSGQRHKVVSISNNAAQIKNATFYGDKGTTFNNNAKFNQQAEFEKQVDMMGFVWKKESNNSLSLVLN